MKKIFTLLFFLLTGFMYVHAQSISPHVISSVGANRLNGSVSLSSNCGEPAIATLTNGSTILTQGFEQPFYDCTYPAGPITGTASVCPNDQDVIYSIAPITGASGYNWILPAGGRIITGANTNVITVNYDPVSSSGNIIVSGTNTCGSGRSSTLAITVKTTPSVASTPPSAVCTGLTSAVLTASGAASYTWAPTANLTPSAGTSVTETAQISQLTFYTLTGTGANGCTANAIIPVATVATGGSISPTFSIICSGNTKTLTVTGAAGHDYQWQISTDNVNWTNITGATNTTYTTASGDGTTNKFYRLMAQSNSCWNVASTTAEVDVSHSTITVTTSNITDNSLTLNWTPTGTGNYTISYSGSSSATLTSVTPPKTITGLTANGTYNITVTQTGLVGCPASGTIIGVTTLCAMPTGLTLSSPASSQILASWTGVPGANYRVYYRPLFSYITYFTKDVSNASSILLTKQGNNNLYASTTYEVYVSRLDCPTTGATGQGTSPTNVTTLPNVSCATPSIDSVRSLCPVQIEVFIHDNGINQYNIFIQRTTPTILAVNSYGVTGTYFTINTPYSGDQYLIAVEAKCGGTLSDLYVWPGNLTIKPLCTSPSNLVLSNPTCHGFTASWNSDQCLSNSASAYVLFLRVAGTINYNDYGVSLPANGIGPHDMISFVTSGRSYQVFVRSIYNCNGFVTYGPSSQIQTVTTLSSGCRDEDVQQPEETKPAVQQYSQDNSEVFSLYPNPNNGEFVVNLSRLNTEEDAVRIEVINMIGQTVMTDLTTISGGHLNEFINLPNGTSAGTYIVRLTAGKNVYTAKVNIDK